MGLILPRSLLITLRWPRRLTPLSRGASAYPRDWDYETPRKVADEHGAYLMADIAHIAGLVAAQELADPFKYCDVVTTTT